VVGMVKLFFILEKGLFWPAFSPDTIEMITGIGKPDI
jgi:hypothetical protein